MSFTFGFSRATLLLAAAACALWTNPSAAGGSMEVCARYAEDAFYAVDDMKKAGCSGVDRSGGPGRFTVNYNEHFNWCRNESTTKTRASEKKTRDAAKNKCLPTLEELVCADFATKGVEASRQWQVFRCTTEHHPTGRFSYKYSDHYNSCMKSGGVDAADEEEARTKELDACKQADSDSRHKPVTKLGVKRTPVKESVDEDESSEEQLQISDAIEGIADATYTPVSKLKVKRTIEDVADTVAEAPVRSAATELIVVGNRYVEVPAYSDNDEGSRIGDVVKASAAGAVLGTAAVATGVVAAKATDYIYEHRDGIKEAAHDLKEKVKERLQTREVTNLKDKLKDRLESTGGFDRIKDGVGTLKDKVKERLQTREVTNLKLKLKDRVGGLGKAMSGAKEALKSKLKDRSGGDGLLGKAASGFKDKLKSKLTGDRSGGGIGSKMLGAAKSGGGLLRRLAGR